jgi:hypothetical protein
MLHAIMHMSYMAEAKRHFRDICVFRRYNAPMLNQGSKHLRADKQVQSA